MYPILRPLLFRLDPETAHHLTLGLLRWGGAFAPARAILRALYAVEAPQLGVRVFGVDFKNPVGLAAGYDKNGRAVRGLAALGFGHLEVGTVTRAAQRGNERPRVWRAPEAHALVNRMGFPNNGIEAVELPPTEARVGINIGKSQATPLEQAAEDYVALIERLHARAGREGGAASSQAQGRAWQVDYCAVNVSSPNTPGLRALQARDQARQLLRRAADARARFSQGLPLLVKIAPDLSFDEVDVLVAAAREVGFDGVIATNTTTSRAGAPAYTLKWQGGLSGAPLRARSTQIVRHIFEQTRGEFPIVGVGGITDAASALEKFHAGASLIQIFTGLVYRGPGLVKEINAALLREPARRGQVGAERGELAAHPLLDKF